MRSGYAEVGGLHMYYEVHGDGRPLVLLHGGLHSIGLSFGKVLPALAAGRQVIAVELQGHGRTADTDRPLTAPDPAHFADFQRKLGAAVAAFAGWSREEVAAITGPALVVVGDNDFVRVDHADEIRRLIAGGQLAVLPGTTHVQVPERAELIVPLVTRFLG